MRQLVRVSSKGQIVLPKSLRDKAGIGQGDYVMIEELEDGVLLLGRMGESPLERLTDSLRREARAAGMTRAKLQQAIDEVRAEPR